MEDKVMETEMEARLSTLVFTPDDAPTIEIVGEHCPSCEGRPCILICPAELFAWDGARVSVLWEKCLECGACRMVCPYDAILWRYPREGRGVSYRWG